ncbi:MAG: MFS transporter [Oscillospiraceae bacterium]|jgi:MFS family permease|nr:MFS transporter [Oscillospiraceae bacterium]
MSKQPLAEKLRGNTWFALVLFGLVGQLAWMVENMYFNVFLYKTVTYNPNANATMVAASALAATLTTLLMGGLSDRIGRRKPFIVLGYLLWGASIAAFAFVSKDSVAQWFPRAQAVTLTTALVVVLDCVMTFFGSTANDAAFNAWSTDVTTPQTRGRAQGVLAAMPLAAMLIIFGGMDSLTQAGNWKAFFLIIAAVVSLGGILGLFLIHDSPTLSPNKTPYFPTLAHGFRPSVIKENGTLYLIFGALAVQGIAMQVFMPNLMVYLEFGLGVKAYALPLAAVLILAAVGSVLGGRLVDKLGKHRLLLVAGGIYAVGMFLMFVSGYTFHTQGEQMRLPLLILCGTVLMGGGLLCGTVLGAAAQDAMPADKRGHFTGIRMVFTVLLPMLIGPFIGAVVTKNAPTRLDEFGAVQYIPPPAMFLWGGVVAILLLPLLLLIHRSLRRALPNAQLLTRWGKVLDRAHPLPEYPRPQFVRGSYLNLNGVWDYAIEPGHDTALPQAWQGEIVVPFSPETLLSGVGKRLQPDETLYYTRAFHVDAQFLRDVTYLHFGAVDCSCRVWVNDTLVGQHSGGFLPFSLDISRAVVLGENTLCLAVTDPTDTSWVSRGKQSSKPGGIWYTPQSGIWQTVWLESVPATHLQRVTIVPNIDTGTVRITAYTSDHSALTATVYESDQKVATATIAHASGTDLVIPDAKLWSPETPFLYDVVLTVGDDEVRSYFGMRKFSVARDESGTPRLCLNNAPYFQNGLLDQGYWSDGLLTAPDDAALIYDIQKMKDLGFNMLRKHIKLEPLRWYYHCDRLGMLVWQDMPSGGTNYTADVSAILPFVGKIVSDGEENYHRFSRADQAGRDAYWAELAAMVDHLENVPSLYLWVPFNEGWGQFDAKKAADFLQKRDPSRLVDHASGWHDQGGGDVVSLHIYFKRLPILKYENERWNMEKVARREKKKVATGGEIQEPLAHLTAGRALVLSEFGGYSYAPAGHVFNPNRVFGYRKYKDLAAYRQDFARLYKEQLQPMIDSSLSAAVYTQVSDVEDETNGLLSFDREITKI